MSQNIDLEALAIEHLQSEHFANYLAECVKTLYQAKLMDEFGDEVARAMEKRVKEVVDEYLAAFEVEADIKKLVDRAITSITKKDLLEKL